MVPLVFTISGNYKSAYCVYCEELFFNMWAYVLLVVKLTLENTKIYFWFCAWHMLKSSYQLFVMGSNIDQCLKFYWIRNHQHILGTNMFSSIALQYPGKGIRTGLQFLIVSEIYSLSTHIWYAVKVELLLIQNIVNIPTWVLFIHIFLNSFSILFTAA